MTRDDNERTQRDTPPTQAVALSYDRDKDPAPRVSAKGFGLIAEKILEIARRNGVPIRFDPDLTHLLAKLDLGERIPRDLYKVVAEVLAAIYRANEPAVQSVTGAGGDNPDSDL
ncbi:EscU/YscU/HrcU family type III secretion system export apparatus switch protein [bacterium]|nr:EscU/YscU/HrcU family type III secretion system export apparatus switch protein [bacterium]